MRLKQRDIDAIKWATEEVFGSTARAHLYGSRVHDNLRGGDIDLLIDVSQASPGIRDVVAFKRRLFERIDEQKVDVVFRIVGTEPSAFVQMIEAEAVSL